MAFEALTPEPQNVQVVGRVAKRQQKWRLYRFFFLHMHILKDDC